MIGVVFFCLLIASVVAQSGLITNLPGAPNVTFAQYSGYIVVNDTHGRNLFYWFVESQRNPATDPLVLWLNGGPGCSSLGGLLSENGPYYANSDGKTLRINPDSWNQVANVLYLESPSGVGFSTSQTPSDYVTGDYQTTQDSLIFLQKWLVLYPQYQKSQFWVTGESYGGHYVPLLAQAILNANAAGQTPKINLIGFQVGNAWTNAELDNEGAVDMWYSHSLISLETYNGFYANCNFSQIGPLKEETTLTSQKMRSDQLCNDYQYRADKDLQYINIYEIYSDVCLEDMENEPRRLTNMISKANPTSPFKYKDPNQQQSRLGDEHADPDPCIDDHMTDYLNLPDVQTAIHAVPTKWVSCSNIVDYSYDDLLSSMIPVYNTLLNTNLRMLVYSGDVDGIVPTTGTKKWMQSMNMTISQPWRYWLDSEQQTGGYIEVYKQGSNQYGLTFATVRDAGHMVPYVQGGRSFDLFSRFLFSQPI